MLVLAGRWWRRGLWRPVDARRPWRNESCGKLKDCGVELVEVWEEIFGMGLSAH